MNERKFDICVIEYREESFYLFTLKTCVGLGGFKRMRKLKKNETFEMSTALKKTLYSIYFWSLIFVLGFEQAWCQPQAWWHSPIILVTSAAE